MKVKRRAASAAQARFWQYVTKTDSCWLWTGAKVRGYGQFWMGGGRTVRAHRQLYEWSIGPIPYGLTLDHECHNEDDTCAGGATCPHRACVRPDHLVPRSTGANSLLGNGPAAKNALATHCSKNHLLGGDNVVRRKGSSGRAA